VAPSPSRWSGCCHRRCPPGPRGGSPRHPSHVSPEIAHRVLALDPEVGPQGGTARNPVRRDDARGHARRLPQPKGRWTAGPLDSVGRPDPPRAEGSDGRGNDGSGRGKQRFEAAYFRRYMTNGQAARGRFSRARARSSRGNCSRGPSRRPISSRKPSF